MANPFDALKSRPAPASPSPFSGGVPGAGMRFTSAPKPVAPAKGFGQGQNVFGGKAAGGVPDRRDVADAGEIKRWITLPNGQVIPIKTPSGSQHLLRTKGSSFFFDPKDNHPYKLDARSPSGIKSAFEDVEAMPDGAGRLVKKVAGQTLDVGEDAAFVAKQAAATAKGQAAEEKKAAEAAKKAESEAKKAEAAGLRTAKAEALVTIGSAKEILAENERQLHLESTSSAKRARMIAEDLRSDGYRLDIVDRALEEASDPQIIENLKKEREGLTALMEGKRKQQETFELDAQRAALREEEYLRGQIGLESELNRKKLAVATMTNTGRLPSVESTTGINAPVATTAPAPTAKPEVPLGQAALDAGEDVSAVVRSIYAQQDSQVEAYRQWRDSVKLDGVMIDRANSPDGAFWDGKRWLDVVPGMKLDTAKEVRAVVLPKVEGMTLAGDEVKVGESRIGEVWRDEAGVPSLLMARNAPGVRSSPSLRSGNPYDGVPEYAEVSPQFIDGLQREGAFAQTGEAIPSEMTRKAKEQWAAQRWDDGQVNGLLTEWRSGNDRDRAEIVKRLQPEAAFAEPNNPQSWRLDTRKLYLGGQISLQQARLLEREFYGVQPGIKPLGKAWEEFKSGESETAQRLAGVVGNKLSSRRQIVGALEQASSAFLADYYKANGHRADFDLAEYNQLRESLAAGEAGSAWWTAQVDNALQNAVGSSAGMLVGVGKFFGTLPQAMGGPKVGMSPEEFGMVSDATLYTGAAMRRNLADRGLFTPSTWWEGKEGKAVTQSIDLLFAKIDNESLTETDFDDLAKEIARSSIQQSQRLGTPDEMQTTPEGWELAREDLLNYYDPSSPQSPLAGLLMAYQATRDPAIRAQFEQMVRSSPDEMEFQERTAAYASAEGTISENDFAGPLRLGFRGGQVAPIQESIVEILSDITTVGMGKALATGVRGAKKVQEAGKAMNIAQRAALGLSRMGERFVQMGLREGKPLQNLLVQGSKQAVTSGITEAPEEFVGAWGQTGATLKDAFVQGLQGAIGGLGLAPIMGGAGVAVDAFQQMRTQRAEMKGYADFAAQWTKDHPDDPIDAAGVKQMAGYMPPVFRAENAAAMKAAAEQMEQALVAAQQAAKDGPPSPEVMAPIEEAHAAALDTLKGHAAELRLRTVAAKEAMQEINGIADPTHRAFADAALKARMGQKLAPREVSALLNSVDETGKALAEETEGGWRFTEAGLNALAESAPMTRESFFPAEENEVTPAPVAVVDTNAPAAEKTAGAEKPNSQPSGTPAPLQASGAAPSVTSGAPTEGANPKTAPDSNSRSKSRSQTLAPKAKENVEPRPPQGGGREGRAARMAWDDSYETTHNPDGTPIQPTLLDETVQTIAKAGKLTADDAQLDAIGTMDVAGTGTAVQQLLDDGWNWNGERMENPANPSETPLQGLLRIRATRDKTSVTPDSKPLESKNLSGTNAPGVARPESPAAGAEVPSTAGTPHFVPVRIVFPDGTSRTMELEITAASPEEAAQKAMQNPGVQAFQRRGATVEVQAAAATQEAGQTATETTPEAEMVPVDDSNFERAGAGEANGAPVSTNGKDQTTNGAPVSTNGTASISGQGQAEVSGVPVPVPTPDGAVGDESSPAAPTPPPTTATTATAPSPAPTEAEGRTMHYVPVKITLPGGAVKTMDLEQMATSPEEAAQRVAQSPVMQAYQRRGATVEVGNTAPAASPAATETRTETSPQSPAPQPAANARNLPQAAASAAETSAETALPETDLGREEPAAAIAAALASKQATQKAEVRPWRKVLEGVATMFGHKLVDTGLPFGYVDQWGKFHSFGTQLLDKMHPGDAIGQWIDKVGNASPEVAAKIAANMSQPFYHRVWFGHDPAANIATIVDKFGVGAVPDYIGQLLKDFMTKAGVPLPGTQWLVHSGIVGDETATKWLSLNVGEAFSGGLALLGSWKLMKKARNGQEIHAGWAMAGIAFKLVGGVMQSNPVLLLSGLSDAVVLTLAKPAAVKAAFEQVAERGDQAEETPETATSEPVAVPEEAKVPWAKDLDFLPAARLYPAMQALEPRLRMMAWDSALRLNATLALYAETFPAGIRFSEKREANLWVNRDGTLNINLPFYLRDTAHTTTREAIMAMVEEELAHIAAMRVMTDTEVVDLWNSLPAAMQRQVYKAYHVSDIAHKRVPSEPKGDWGNSAWNYGHEFVRMLVTDREFQGRVAEAVEVDPGFGAKIVAWLKTFIARLRKGIEALPPAQRSAVKEYEYRVRQALREMLKLPPLQKPTAEQTRSTGQRIEKLRAWMRSQPRDASVWAALTDKGDVLSIPGNAATTPWDARKQLASQARLRGQWLAWDAGLAGLNVPWEDVNEELNSWQSRSAQQMALLADPSIVENLREVDYTLSLMPMPTEEDYSEIGPPEIEEAQLQRATLPKQMELGLDPIARRRDLRGKRDMLVRRIEGMTGLIERKVWDTPEQEAKLRKDLARYEALLAKVEGKMLADYGPGEIERKVDKPVDMQNVNPGQGSKPSPQKAGVAEGPKVDTAAAVGGRGEVRSEKSPAAEGKVPSPADAKAAAIAYQEEVLADAQATEAAKEKARKVLAKLRGPALPAGVETVAAPAEATAVPEKPAAGTINPNDPNLGREWNAPYGRQRIIKAEFWGGRWNYDVGTVGTSEVRSVADSQLEKTIERNEYDASPEGIEAKKERTARYERQLQREADAAAKKAELTAKTAEYLDTLNLSPMVRGKLAATLDVQIGYRYGATEYSGDRAQVLRRMIDDGFTVTTEEVPAIKEVSRRRYNQMSAAEQTAYERKREQGGTKTEYRLVSPKETFFIITKAEYDYAQWLLDQKEKAPAVSNDTVESAPESVNPTPVLAASAEETPVSAPPAAPATIGQENINARPSVAWADVSTPGTMSNPNGSLRAAATQSQAPSGVWYYQGDIQQLAFNERATVNGQSSSTPYGKQVLAEAQAAKAAGWTYTNVKSSRMGTVWVFRKGDQVLTRAGAAALASGKMERPDVQPSEAGYQSMIDRFGAYSAKLVEWLQTLKPSTLDSASALSNKLGNGLISKWVRLVPNPYSTGERFTLQFLKEDGGAELALYGDTVDRIIEEVVRYAAAWRDRTGEGLDPLFRAISYEEQQANVWRKPSEAMAALGFPAAGEETPVTPPPSATPTTRLQDLNAPELLSPAEWLAAGRSEEEHRKLIREAMGLGKRRPVNAATVAAYEMTPPALYVRKGEQLVYGPLEAKLEEQKRRQGKSKKGETSPPAEFGSGGVAAAPVQASVPVMTRDATKPEQMTVEELAAETKRIAVEDATEALEAVKSGRESPNVFTNGFRNKAEMIRARKAALLKAQEMEPVADIWGTAITATQTGNPIWAGLIESLDDTDKQLSPGPAGEPGGTVESIRKQLIQSLSDKGYKQVGDFFVMSDKAAPEPAPVKPTTAAAETPAKAEAKVEEHLQDVKATEGTRPAAEIKAELLATVTTLLKETRQRAAAETGNGNLSYEQLVKAGHGDLVDNMSFEKREFQIPGDGTFTMVLNGRNLAELLKRIKSLPVKDTGKVESSRGGAGEGTAASAKDVAAKLYTVAAVRSWVVNAINGDPFAAKVIEAYRKTDNPEGIKVDEIEAEVQALLNGEESAPVEPATPAEAVPESTVETPALAPEAAPASPVVENVAKAKKKRAEAAAKIEDFGEKIGGARKDVWGKMRLQLDAELPAENLDITMSKHWPEPNYEALIAQGVDAEGLAAMKALRDMIPTKPQRGYQVQKWAQAVRYAHGLMQEILKNEGQIPAEMRERIQSESPLIAMQIRLYQQVGFPLVRQLKGWKLEYNTYSYFRGIDLKPGQIVVTASHKGRTAEGLDGKSLFGVAELKDYATWESATDGIIARIKERLESEAAADPEGTKPRVPARPMENYKIYQDRFSREYFIGRRGINGVVRMKAGFTSVAGAREYLVENKDAIEAHWESLKIKPNYRNPINAARQGPARRGDEVSPGMFQEAFGFRGVEFGNWVEDKRRQEDLNEAYDALVDLAEVLDVPTQALSLDGSLGLAFGARGHSGAKAHYEPGSVVINLTKESGPGSLAHEWWHGLDNYFARYDQRGETQAVPLDRMITKISGPAKNIRPEVLAAFQRIAAAVGTGPFAERSKKLDDARSKPYYGTTVEKTARAFERYVRDRLAEKLISNDYLVNIGKDESEALPTAEEMRNGIKAAYDALFDALETKETERGQMLFTGNRAAPASPIDTAAQGAATAVGNGLAEPTEAQKEAGNYAKGHVRVGGLDISIENPAGSVRRGVGADGKAWETTMQAHYGYVRGTEGPDGDHLDVFIAPGTPAEFRGTVYVVEQTTADGKAFDEHKAVFGRGINSPEAAGDLYHANYEADWKGGYAIQAMPWEQFKVWAQSPLAAMPLEGRTLATGNRAAPAASDAEYLAALKAGDSGSDNLIQLLRDAPESNRRVVVDAWLRRNPKAAANTQRMVDEAAKAAGWNGSDKWKVTVSLKPGWKTARTLGDAISSPSLFASFPALKTVRLRFDNSLQKRTQKAHAEWSALDVLGWQFNEKIRVADSPLMNSVSAAQVLVHEAVHSHQAREGRALSEVEAYAVERQIKSADPVTYDSAGNVIPLSQRFNPQSDSILYTSNRSAPAASYAAAKEEAAKRGAKAAAVKRSSVLTQVAGQRVLFKRDARSFWADVVSGNIDRIDYYAPGFRNIWLDTERQMALARAAVNSLFETLNSRARRGFGYPAWWKSKAVRAKWQEFQNVMLPTAARLEASGVNERGEFEFKDFMMRAGRVPVEVAEKAGLGVGDVMNVDGEALTLGPSFSVRESNATTGKGKLVSYHLLLRPVSAADQQATYRAFVDEWAAFPVAKELLDEFIMPGLDKGRFIGPRQFRTAEFNRYSLRDVYNEWPDALREQFGALPELEFSDGYVPEVPIKSGISAIAGGVFAELLRSYQSPARRFAKQGLRESGDVKNLFEGFQTQLMQAHLEKVRMERRGRLLKAAAVPEAQIPVADRHLWMPVNDAFEMVYEAVVLARNLDRGAFPALTGALNPQQVDLMRSIVGEAWMLRGRAMHIPAAIYNEMLAEVATAQTENLLLKLMQWFMQQFNAASLASFQYLGMNFIGNEILKTAFAVQSGYKAMVFAMSGRMEDKARARLALSTARYLMQGAILDRFPLRRERFREILPREIFDTNHFYNALQGMDEGVLDNVKKLQFGSAFLAAVRAGNWDVGAKVQLANAMYQAYAREAWRDAAKRDVSLTRLSKEKKREWLKNYVATAPATVHREVEMAAGEWLMNYENTPRWMNSGAIKPFIDPTKPGKMSQAVMAAQMKKLAIAAFIPFLRWSYLFVRKVKRTAIDEGVRNIVGATGNTREGIANLLALGTLVAAPAMLTFLKEPGGDDDEWDKVEAQLLGRSRDMEGKDLDRTLKATNRFNVSALARIAYAKLGFMEDYNGEAFTVTDNAGQKADVWLRYRNYPFIKEGIVLGLWLQALRGSNAPVVDDRIKRSTGNAAGNITAKDAFGQSWQALTGEYVSLGLGYTMLESVLAGAMSGSQSADAMNDLRNSTVDLLTSPVLPHRLMRDIGVLVDPTDRRSRPSARLGYDPGWLETFMARIPGLKSKLPLDGEVAAPTILSAKSSVPPAEQAELLKHFDIPATAVTYSKDRPSRDAFLDLRMLKDLGAGPQDVGLSMSKTTKSAPKPLVAVPKPDQVRQRNRWIEALRMTSPINTLPVNQTAYRAAVTAREKKD